MGWVKLHAVRSLGGLVKFVEPCNSVEFIFNDEELVREMNGLQIVYTSSYF